MALAKQKASQARGQGHPREILAKDLSVYTDAVFAGAGRRRGGHRVCRPAAGVAKWRAVYARSREDAGSDPIAGMSYHRRHEHGMSTA